MHSVALQSETDFAGWRQAARAAVLAGRPPEAMFWTVADSPSLFTGAGETGEGGEPKAAFTVPRRFVELAGEVILHRDPERFALLYRLLWRLRRQHDLLDLSVDPDVVRAAAMAKAVHRDIHKTHGFVRFREVAEAGGRFVAWFEPEHHTLEASAPFFARRYTHMAWSILTPEASAHWDGEALAFGPGAGRREAPDADADALEDIWRGYYVAIFNPARLKVDAMRSEMPRKYWRNLPEAALIGPLIADARRRTEDMIAQPHAAAKANPQRTVPKPAVHRRSNDPLEAVREAAMGCRNCPLWKPATQTVFGEGPPDAEVVLLGEQPGDKEDLAGKPFVGPAGQLLDRAMKDAELDRAKVYVTNAVKHFKFTPRGKIRLHQKPNVPEIRACRPWLEQELEIIKPRLVVAMGATAVQSLFGRAMPIGKNRGKLMEVGAEMHGLVTMHPSFLLRVPDAVRKQEEYAHFVGDLRLAARAIAA